MRLRAVLVAAGIATLAVAPSARAEVFTVTTTSDGTGTCDKTNCTTIRAAMTAAAATTGADTINVPPGTTTLTAGDLVPPSSVLFQGAGARSTVIQGDGKARIFTIGGERIVDFANLTMANGTATGGQGGNLLVGPSARVTLNHVRVTGGRANQGAGIAATSPLYLLIGSSLIDNNTAAGTNGDGGGVYFAGSGSASRVFQLLDSTVALNTAVNGGGLAFASNASTTGTLTRDTIARNTSSESRGGGIHLDSTGPISATASIVANNTGNVSIGRTPQPGPANCTIAFNDAGANVESQTDCGFKLPSDRQSVDPALSTALVNAGGQTDLLTLGASSVAVNFAGACSAQAAAIDQRDMPRPQGPACDAGAYEYVLLDTTITKGRTGASTSRSAAFMQTSTDPLAGFECRLDGPGVAVGTFQGCKSTQSYSNLADGAYTFRVRAVHGDLVDDTPATNSFTVDTTAPAAPAITTPSGNVTQNSKTVALSGTAEAGSTVEVFDSGVAKGTTTATGGTWSITLSNVADGAHPYTATAKDGVGLTSVPSAARTITIDTAAPAAPAITTPAVDVPAQGSTTVTLSGTAESGANVQVLDGTTVKGTVPATGGNWSITLSNVADGIHSYTAKATDSAGNVSAPSNTRKIGIDTGAPAAPTFTGPADNALLNSSTVPLTGTAEASSTVQIFEGATSRGTVVAAADGKWALSLNNVPEGSHTYTATAKDAAGNTSAASTGRTVRIDTQPPPLPAITTPAGNTTQNSRTVTLSGTAESGATVAILDNGASKGTVTATGGNWTTTLTNVVDGVHPYTVTAKDAAGNTSGTSPARTITIDTVAPNAPVITSPAENGLQNSTVTLSGTAEPDATVEVFEGAASRGTTTANGTGGWTRVITGVIDGTHMFTATARDAAGNVSSNASARTVRVDAAAPAAPAIASPADNVLQNASTVTLSGTAEANASVTVFEGSTQRGTTAAAGNGAWTLTLSAVPDGIHVYTARATDGAGKTSGDSNPRTVTVDTTPPPADVVAGPDGPTTETAPSFAFSADTAAVTECRLDGPGAAAGSYGPCTSPASFSGLAPGAYLFSVRATDAAGNETVTTRAFSVALVQPQPQPTPTPTPTPVPGKSVVIQPVSGKTLVQLPGSSKFEPVDVTRGIPFNAVVDTRKSKIRLYAIPKAGKPAEGALFYDGIFKVTAVGEITQLTLVEKLAACPKGKAASAAAKKKPKTRKLWGDGTGSFRTRGQYSSATVRGTKWLVQDSCGKTLTRVAKGVVSVQDLVKKKTLLVRAPKSYTAKKKR